MRRPKEFKSANYPVAPRRHLLEPGTVWHSGTAPTRRGGFRVMLTNIYEEAGEVVIVRLKLPGDPGLPSGSRISTRSFLRNYRREDEADPRAVTE